MKKKNPIPCIHELKYLKQIPFHIYMMMYSEDNVLCIVNFLKHLKFLFQALIFPMLYNYIIRSASMLSFNFFYSDLYLDYGSGSKSF